MNFVCRRSHFLVSTNWHYTYWNEVYFNDICFKKEDKIKWIKKNELCLCSSVCKFKYLCESYYFNLSCIFFSQKLLLIPWYYLHTLIFSWGNSTWSKFIRIKRKNRYLHSYIRDLKTNKIHINYLPKFGRIANKKKFNFTQSSIFPVQINYDL